MVISNLPAGRPAPVKIRRQATRDVLNDLWRSSFPIRPEDPVGVYLAARRLTLDAACKALRYFPLLPHHPTATWHPGLLALFSDASGQAKQIQRTYLTEQGSKADIIPNRMFMPGEMPVGGAIRLGPPAETMGVTEGVETALAASQRFGMVVWATTSEVLLQKWVPPPEARRIIVFGDNDASFVGQRAAYTLAARLVHEAVRDKVECEIEVRIPEATGTDWADQ
jgi:putative DNA primase/helicase